jgi:hypothetical protein
VSGTISPSPIMVPGTREKIANGGEKVRYLFFRQTNTIFGGEKGVSFLSEKVPDTFLAFV